MNIKDQIRAEVERLKDEYTDIAIDSHYGTVNANHVVVDLEQLLSFLDTLPEQPMEGLEGKDFIEEVREYYSNNGLNTWDALQQPMLSTITRCARHFAEWGAEHIKK